MYAIKFNININWTKMIMNQMWHVRGSQSPLPYAIFNTKILEHFGVPLEGETKGDLNIRESKVDIEVVHKMGFVIDPVTHTNITKRRKEEDRQRLSKIKLQDLDSKSLGLLVNRLPICSNRLLRAVASVFQISCERVSLQTDCFSNHSQISDIELQLMYAIKFNIKINWTKMIMQQMWHVRGSQSLLPYAIFITKILEHFGVSLDGETKVALNLHEIKVDIEVFHKMGFVIDLVTRRTYKHCTDRQPAPTDELEPTTKPNQPESHAQSSSSAAMPKNQMIMDELVFLRGYITTRMDAFDTQSQQIHYELHRLSSRLSNMDVDEDSSEPDS
ncbi:hypothetical protein Lal_00039434 [Lupinus albus]|nr:hypothetical protein Lal_00039434 [Lupinus albus]